MELMRIQLRLTGLWRHADFMRLWTGQTVSQFGSMITGAALPLTALLVLQATPAQMGVLAAIGAAPVLLVSLFAGVWVDRLHRRPLLIAADLGRAGLLASIPLAALLGVLRIEHLYAVAGLAGVLTVLFDVAYQSYLPSLVQREHIVEANSKLGMSDSLAEVAGNALGGVLVQLFTAPLTMVIDALSFVFSATCLGLIRTREPAPAKPAHGQNVWMEIRAGLLVGAGGIGALLGAFVATWITRRFGLGRTMVGALFVAAGLQGLTPLAGGTPLLAVSMLFVAQIVGDVAWAVHAINERSLRQSVAPGQMLGRVNASTQFLVGGVGAVGLLAGGLLGEVIGVRLTLGIAVAGMLLSGLWVLLSPIRRLRDVTADSAAHSAEPERA
ncbi:MAG: MFS transporter [Chloroflexi bacterium]|nr:MFS transporter [Chloroflexota bacterium]